MAAAIAVANEQMGVDLGSEPRRPPLPAQIDRLLSLLGLGYGREDPAHTTS